jgi:hypothetical protein
LALAASRMEQETRVVENRISLKIDLKSGLIELDAPAESFEQAIAQTKELAGSLDFSAPAEAQAPKPTVSGAATEPSTIQEPIPAPARNGAARRMKTSKASAGRTGRIGSFEEVKGLLTEQQEIELRQFYVEKAPTEQSHQVLVAIVKGEQLLGRRGLGYNEIYTLMWLGGIKPLPRALDVVLLRLIQEQMVVREEGGFAAKFIGRDFVEQQLPKAAS